MLEIDLADIAVNLHLSVMYYKEHAGIHDMGRAKRKDVFEHTQYALRHIYPTHVQFHPGICFPFMQSMVYDDSVSGQRRP